MNLTETILVTPTGDVLVCQCRNSSWQYFPSSSSSSSLLDNTTPRDLGTGSTQQHSSSADGQQQQSQQQQQGSYSFLGGVSIMGGDWSSLNPLCLAAPCGPCVGPQPETPSSSQQQPVKPASPDYASARFVQARGGLLSGNMDSNPSI